METSIPTPTLDAVKAHRTLMAARVDLRSAARDLMAATSIYVTPDPSAIGLKVAAVNAAHLNLIAAADAYAQAKA